MTTRQQLKSCLTALEAIEGLVGDDFCADLEMLNASKKIRGKLKVCNDKLRLIYKIAHSQIPSHSCHRVHKDWRKLKYSMVKEWSRVHV